MVMSDVLTHWSHGRDGSRAGVCPEQPEAGLADLGSAMLLHPSSGSATEALAMCNPTGRATWPAISAQREVAELGCGSTASRLQRGRLWWPAAEGGEPDHQGTWGQCFAQASCYGSFEYLPSCRTVGFSIFPGNLFPVAWDLLQLNRVAEIKGPVSILSLLRASLYPWPEHSCRRQQRRENEGKRWWRLSYSGKESDAGNKRFSCMSCSYLSLSLGLITDPLTLEISCDNTESQNSWG